jgi:hypothetical protein
MRKFAEELGDTLSLIDQLTFVEEDELVIDRDYNPSQFYFKSISEKLKQPKLSRIEFLA